MNISQGWILQCIMILQYTLWRKKKNMIIVVCNSLIIINSIHVIVMLLLFKNISLLNSCFLLSNYQLNVLGQSEWFSSNICKIWHLQLSPIKLVISVNFYFMYAELEVAQTSNSIVLHQSCCDCG